MAKNGRFLLIAILLMAIPLLAQSVAEFDIPIPNARPYWLTAGSDGAIWFTMSGARSIGRITSDGRMTAFEVDGTPLFLTVAADGNLWFTMADSPAAGVIEPNGNQHRFVLSSDSSALQGITAAGNSVYATTSSGRLVEINASGAITRDRSVPAVDGPAPSLGAMVTASDSSIWFADQRAGAPRVGRAVPFIAAGSPPVRSFGFTFVALPAHSTPFALAPGENGAVWFTDLSGRIGRAAREAALSVTSVPGGPFGIARAADGSIWVSHVSANRLSRIDPATLAVTEVEIPTMNSGPAGIALGGDGAIWFAERSANKMARVGALPVGPDLAVSIEGDQFVAAHLGSGQFIVWIGNNGTETARAVSLLVEPARRILSSTSERAGCNSTGLFELSCMLGDIQPGEVVAVTIVQDLPGHDSSTSVSVESSSAERNLTNNSARFLTTLINCDEAPIAGACPLLHDLAERICESRAGARAIGSIIGEIGLDIDVFYGLRDRLFSRTAAGRRYTELYYTHGREIGRLFFFNPTVAAQAFDTLRAWQEPLRALVDGEGSSATLTAAQIAALQTVLDNLKRLGSAELRAVIEREEGKLQLGSLAGQTMNQALARHTATAPATVTLPVAASLHGVGSTFFHSDVRVFNAGPSPKEVTARYRCFTSSCGSGVLTFTLAPGEMKVFDDIVARQFSAPESGGAIEFEGDVIVDSRLYTPEAGAPTTGMYVPALTASSAFAESVLLSLSHSSDGSVGFRTNAGAYNPNDVGLDVQFILHDGLGHEIGRVSRFIPARTPLQVNNIFATAGVSAGIDGAYAIVRADGVHELFAFASVIDNQSQDLIFVTGKNGKRGSLGVSTLAAAASLHGIPPTFFHSDVTVFNPSAVKKVEVTARYRCSIGACGSESATFEVEPGQARRIEDAVVALFNAPESGGAIEFVGPVIVDSRLYTPSRPAPSSGMYIPAAQDEEAHAESVLLSLSHSADSSTGFRTNAGAYNPNLVALDVTFTLFHPSGQRLSEVTRRVAPLASAQVNNVFATAGVSVDVPSAYCVVRADGLHKIFAFASVIDNRSQDLIFVRASRRSD